MSSFFTETLADHRLLSERRSFSQQKLEAVKIRLSDVRILASGPLTAFAAGSLARGEAGNTSDLDIFLTTDDAELAESRLTTFSVIAELIRVNEAEGFPSFSNDGQYLRIYSLADLIRHTGSPRDDGENYFTARMLMLLEGQPLIHEAEFREHQGELIRNYSRDSDGKDDFLPLFLLNDILRYWRTLCLNYEQTRHDPDRPWRKKNVNLKFSRMVTVFGTVLPMLCLPRSAIAPGADLWGLAPLDRLASGLDALEDQDLLERWPAFLDAYAQFLEWKAVPEIESQLSSLRAEIQGRADEVAFFLYDALRHERIPQKLRRYLIL